MLLSVTAHVSYTGTAIMAVPFLICPIFIGWERLPQI